nr:T-box protein 2-like [Onthophagus taurus]
MTSVFSGSNYFYDMEPPVIVLVDTHLWKMFNKVGTEMIITKNGRKLFPTIKIRLYNLDPNAEYDVALHMKMSRNCRLKFQAKSGWKEAGNSDPKASKDIYVHFESGKTGHELMMKPLSFDKIRVTNSLPAALSSSGSMEKYNDFICLNSMHEYLPTVVLTMRTPYGNRTFCYPLELTKFVAVTAYQNQQVTEIKINKNPFAKGFRADGQAKKRKPNDTVEEPKSKRISSESPQEDAERLSPYQSFSETLIPPWSIHPMHTMVPCSFLLPPQSNFPYSHVPSLRNFEMSTQGRYQPDVDCCSLSTSSNLSSTPSSSPVSTGYSKVSQEKKFVDKPNENHKLGFSIHRILYEL